MKETRKGSRYKTGGFDVDGVLTDGTLFLGDDGLEYKAFNSKDGLGMKMLQRSGVEIGIITARNSRGRATYGEPGYQACLSGTGE